MCRLKLLEPPLRPKTTTTTIDEGSLGFAVKGWEVEEVRILTCPPAHSAGITIQCCARVCVCVYVHIWDYVDGGGVRYCVAFACKNGIGDPDPYPIPIFSIFFSKTYVKALLRLSGVKALRL